MLSEDDEFRKERRGGKQEDEEVGSPRRNICALNYFTDLVDRYGL